MNTKLSRRELLGGGSMIAVGLMTPPWLASIAKADFSRLAGGMSIDPDTVLIVCELTGGNDGLNTIIPYAESAYREMRPNLSIDENSIIKLDEYFGLHPSLGGLHKLIQEDKVAIVHNVGYPNPNRSHFKSMEIWQSASPDSSQSYGWIGRHFDTRMTDESFSPISGLGLSIQKPRALQAQHASIPCFGSLADIQSMIGDPDAERILRSVQEIGGKGSTNTASKASLNAFDAMSELNRLLGTYQVGEEYGSGRFGTGFKQIAQVVCTSPKTRVIYFNVGGFDTHSRQLETHAQLLQDFSDGLHGFQREIEKAGRADKVMVVVFSEFGRRTYENGSLGTDHGQAAPMLLVGKNVKGGHYGNRPDMKNLDNGDIRWDIDFRQVYATALDQWLGGDSAAVLGDKFNHIDCLR